MKKKKPIRNRWLRMGQYSLSWRHTPLTALLLFQLAHSGEAFAEIPPAEHLLNTSYSADQDQIITGQVKDVNGNPLQGVTVSVMDNERVGTSTDANGRFVLEVEGN
ncbi:MAG: carboxypeptidase-like regulatory domain-containing protein, partial [Sphingobacterium sp.]